MLARVADNLFWMGRYVERAEHMARYLNVNYFSSLDAPNPVSQSREFVLRSMLAMAGQPHDPSEPCLEPEVLHRIGMDPDQPNSISVIIQNARMNAQSARDLISTELYESINKFYHFAADYPPEKFVKTGLFDYTMQVTEMTAVIRGKIRGTLLHDAIYAIIMMGVNLERGLQVGRIIQAKYLDAQKASGGDEEVFRNSYEWTTLLKCCESYDMMRRLYKKQPTSHSTLEFLILNPQCPRSVMNSVNQISRHISILDAMRFRDPESAAFLVGKVRAAYQYTRITDIQDDLGGFISEMLNTLQEMGSGIEREFFLY